MTDQQPQVPGVTVSVTVTRDDGSVTFWDTSFEGVPYLTEEQLARVTDGVAGVVLTPLPDDDGQDVDTSRMFGGGEA